MLKNKSYYKKIFNELIPRSKKYNSLNFCECVNIEKFFKDLKIIDFESFSIISKKKCTKDQIIELLGDYILESYFLSKKFNKRLVVFEKKNFDINSYVTNQSYLLKELKINGKKK